MSDPVAYIRARAAKLRTAAVGMMDEGVRSDYTSGARYLELVAEELDAEMHVSDEED